MEMHEQQEQEIMMNTYLTLSDELVVSFGDVVIEVTLDEEFYPNGKKIIDVIKDINYDDHSIKNLLLIKKQIWLLRELLREHLNRIYSSDPDYETLEDLLKKIEIANWFLFLGIRFYNHGKNSKELLEYITGNPLAEMN